MQKKKLLVGVMPADTVTDHTNSNWDDVRVVGRLINKVRNNVNIQIFISDY